MRTLVVIPTYNEKENIELIIPQVLEVDSSIEVLVVDDNSPDGTAAIVQKLQKWRMHVCLLMVWKIGCYGMMRFLI